MAELASVLDAPAAVDVEKSAGEQLEFVAAVAAGVNRLSATSTSAVRAADAGGAHRVDGAVSTRARLRGQYRLSAGEAAAIVTTGRRSEQLPAVAGAFAAGEITAVHGAVITRAMTPARLARAAGAGIELAGTNRMLAGGRRGRRGRGDRAGGHRPGRDHER